MSTPSPSVTIAICSRNRPDDLRRAVLASLLVLPEDGELLVIDQTEDEATVPLDVDDPRLRYQHRPGRGVAVSRNAALRAALSPIVVFTDDDCEPRAGVVQLLLSVFEREDVAVAFGTVAAEPCDAGFIATYRPPRGQVLTGRTAKLRDGGIGACMAVRRDAALAVGGFDERFGPGASLPSNEEGEFTYRSLRAGYAVAHVPEATVDHRGVRLWHEGRRYSFDTYRAIAATYAMHARSGDIVAVQLLAQQLGLVLVDLVKAFLSSGRPAGFSKLHGLAAGMLPGFALQPIRPHRDPPAALTSAEKA